MHLSWRQLPWSYMHLWPPVHLCVYIHISADLGSRGRVAAMAMAVSWTMMILAHWQLHYAIRDVHTSMKLTREAIGYDLDRHQISYISHIAFFIDSVVHCDTHS